MKIGDGGINSVDNMYRTKPGSQNYPHMCVCVCVQQKPGVTEAVEKIHNL